MDRNIEDNQGLAIPETKTPQNRDATQQTEQQTLKVSQPTQETKKTITVKIVKTGEIISKNISQTEFDKYQGSLSYLPLDEKTAAKEILALPETGYEIKTNIFGRSIKYYPSSLLEKAHTISDLYIVNVLSPDKTENVKDFSAFPLEISVPYKEEYLAKSNSYAANNDNLSIYYWAGDEICTEKSCGYYVRLSSSKDNVQNGSVKALATKPGQYIVGIHQ